MQFIDFGITDRYDHADNLHEHTRNENLKDEELKDYTPGANAEHFLDHKVNNILDAMRSVGDYEQADRFREIYDSTVDNDLIEADNLVNTYRDVVKDMSFDDADLNKATDIAIAAKFRNNGQVCISPNRFYIHEQKKD